LKPQVDKQHYLTEDYLDRGRFIALREQLMLCLESNGDIFLEVGPGPGLLTSLLRQFGKTVFTLDYDHSLKPDIVASVLNIPCPADHVDVTCAFQILEHLPFAEVTQALTEMRRVSRKLVIFSVPDHAGLRKTRFGVKIRILGRELNYENTKPIFSGITNPREHRWEIGCNEIGTSDIMNAIDDAQLRCMKHFIPYSYFHFFVCCKC
jgi:ubiquinone/menaquinone biosynthesis C-methylase UbiE